MSKKTLRDAITKETNWSPQVLSNRVAGVRKASPMPTWVAQAVVAHQIGIRIDKHFLGDPLTVIQAAIGRISGASVPQGAVASEPLGRARKGAKLPNPGRMAADSQLLAPTVLKDIERMQAVYGQLYIIENSMRSVIRLVMAAKYGSDWWETMVNGKVKTVRENADQRRRGENARRWHQKRGAHPIDYTDLKDLGSIIQAHRAEFFPAVFGDGDAIAWFESFMRELEPSRNVVCHMNPLDAHNVKDIAMKLERWKRVIATWRAQKK
ncbi:MAG TPA: Swt1 family HEPN domain-containing protein [Gemmatimonadales bacterium]|jgi:hypothetical protein